MPGSRAIGQLAELRKTGRQELFTKSSPTIINRRIVSGQAGNKAYIISVMQLRRKDQFLPYLDRIFVVFLHTHVNKIL